MVYNANQVRYCWQCANL